MKSFHIGNRQVGEFYPPFVIAEIGINHNGETWKASKMIEDAAACGVDAVKLQTHIPEAEMIPNDVVPENASETLWEMMHRCSLSDTQESELQHLAESLNLVFLSTPFSIEAVDRLEKIGLKAYKIGSGEASNLPLLQYVASKRKPVLLSTGMHDIQSLHRSVSLLRGADIPFALMHCTSLYPTPYDKVRLPRLQMLKQMYPDAVIGVSDHSLHCYTAIAAVALGACIVEKHFTSSKNWCGPDVPISLNPPEMKCLVDGVHAVYESMQGRNGVLSEEKDTIRFAFASVVTVRDVKEGEVLNEENIWVKRPGTGGIWADNYYEVIGRIAKKDIPVNTQVDWRMLE